MTEYKVSFGSYFLMDGERIVAGMGEQVSVVISVSEEHDTYTMHKHGQTEYVKKWFDNAVSKFRAAGFDEMADELKMYTGPFPVEELNKLAQCSGYAQKFYEKMRDNTMEKEPEVSALDYE